METRSNSVTPDRATIINKNIVLSNPDYLGVTDLDTAPSDIMFLLCDDEYKPFLNQEEKYNDLQDIKLSYLRRVFENIGRNDGAFNFGYQHIPSPSAADIRNEENGVTHLPIEQFGGTEQRPYYTIDMPEFKGWVGLHTNCSELIQIAKKALPIQLASLRLSKKCKSKCKIWDKIPTF